MNIQEKSAIVRVEILDDSRNLIDWGTGFLAGPQLILTAYHVVADRKQANWTCRGRHVQVVFSGVDTALLVDSQNVVDADRDLDFAALRLMGPPPSGVKPLRLATVGAMAGARYNCWGFARLNPSNGFTVTGTVTDPHAHIEEGNPALQLYAHEASGPDAELKGLSGSPCIVGGRVFGVVRSFPTVNGYTVAGATIYACPSSIVVKRHLLLGKLEPGGGQELPTLAVIVPGYDDFSKRLKAAFRISESWGDICVVEEDPIRALWMFQRACERQGEERAVFFVDIQPRYEASKYLEMIRMARAIGRTAIYKPIFVLSGALAWFDGYLRPMERHALEKYYRLGSAAGFDVQDIEVLATRCSEDWRSRPQSGPGTL